jgi:hypothetical protein
MTGSGERRALSGSASASDYTVTTDVTFISGEGGIGIWLRANSDASTAYCVQVDHGFGQIVLRERQAEQELSTPLARTNPPAGFVWYGQPHLLSVTIKGNSLTATLDGTQVLNVPSLTEASAFATARSTGLTVSIVPPTAGGYGVRTWSTSLVHFQRVTAGPAL